MVSFKDAIIEYLKYNETFTKSENEEALALGEYIDKAIFVQSYNIVLILDRALKCYYEQHYMDEFSNEKKEVERELERIRKLNFLFD